MLQAYCLETNLSSDLFAQLHDQFVHILHSLSAKKKKKYIIENYNLERIQIL